MIMSIPQPSTSNGGAQPGDGVHHQQRIAAAGVGFPHRAGNAFHVVAGAGRALRGLHVDAADAVAVAPQPFTHGLQGERLAVRGGHQFHLAAVGFRQIAPTLAELAGAEHQNLVSGLGQVRRPKPPWRRYRNEASSTTSLEVPIKVFKPDSVF